jgi:hypothetical protein
LGGWFPALENAPVSQILTLEHLKQWQPFQRAGAML